MSKCVIVAGFCVLFSVVAAPVARAQPLSDEQSAELARHFGFGPLQMYKLDPSIGMMRLADLNQDGRTDVILWSSHKSRLEILYQADPAKPDAGKADSGKDPAGKSDPGKDAAAKPGSGKDAAATPAGATTAPAAGGERNELPNRGDMKSENIPLAYRVAALEVADLTGDKINDIVFFGEPKEVVILAGKKGGGFAAPVGLRAPEGSPQPGCLCIGDFNHDQRTDVAVLGEQSVLVFLQKAGGGLEKPVKLMHSIKQALLMLAGDFDGDGRDDLVIGSNDEQYGAVIRLQESSGMLGPQRRIKTPALRSMTVVENAGGDDLLCIQHATNRLIHFRWDAPDATAGQVDWPERIYSYPSAGKGKLRPVAVGDITGDGLPDVVAADPDGAQLFLFEQKKDTGLAGGVAFPGLVKTIDACVADVDSDGKNEVLSVSADEKLIGVSRFADGRLTFPAPFAVTGTPYAVTAGNLAAKAEKPTHVAYVSKVDGKFTIRIAPAGAAGRTAESAASEPAVDAGDLNDDPAALRLVDVDQDGRNDLLLFVKFGGLQTYLQGADGKFARLSGAETREGMLKEATLPGFAMEDVTGDGKPELLLAQKNLVRALVVKGGQWTVVDQYNPESGDAEISGVAALPGSEAGSPTIAMYDRKAKEVLVFKRRPDHTYAVSQSIPTGAYELTAMFAAPLGGKRDAVLVMADAQTLSVMSPAEAGKTLVEKHSYETTVKDAWLADAVAGDLNHDGVRDVAVIDAGKAHIDVLTAMPDGRFVKATRFQVFQGKRFSDSPESRRQPREALIGDVTGDKIDDLIVTAHDRVIVYPGQ